MTTLCDEIIKGEIHFPLCSMCHQPMDWLQVFQYGEAVTNMSRRFSPLRVREVF